MEETKEYRILFWKNTVRKMISIDMHSKLLYDVTLELNTVK